MPCLYKSAGVETWGCQVSRSLAVQVLIQYDTIRDSNFIEHHGDGGAIASDFIGASDCCQKFRTNLMQPIFQQKFFKQTCHSA